MKDFFEQHIKTILKDSTLSAEEKKYLIEEFTKDFLPTIDNPETKMAFCCSTESPQKIMLRVAIGIIAAITVMIYINRPFILNRPDIDKIRQHKTQIVKPYSPYTSCTNKSIGANTIAELDQILYKHPNDYILYQQKAYCYYDMGLWRNSVEQATKSIELAEKGIAPSFMNLMLTGEGKEPIKISPLKSYLKRAMAYYELKEYSKAVDDFTKTIEIKPNSTYYLAWRGSALYYAGKKEQALADFEKVKEIKTAQGINLYDEKDTTLRWIAIIKAELAEK